MAKVKIQGHASGTGVLTVTAPNTSTDRTITLPDSTATLFTDAGGTMTGNLTVSNAEPQIHLSDTDATASGYAKIRGGASGAVFLEADPTNAESNSHITFKIDNTQMGRFTTDGLCFNSDSAAANALDDYEYGTWTPTFYLNHIGSHTLNYANYVKVGRLVTINMYVYNFGSIGGTGISFGITNLPFSQNVQALGVVTATHTDFHNYYGHAVARLYNGVAYIEQTRDATGGHWLDYSAFNANSHIQMSIAYETSV